MEKCRTCRLSTQDTISSLDTELAEWVKSNLKIKILDSTKICKTCIGEIKLWTSFNEKMQPISHSNGSPINNGTIELQISAQENLNADDPEQQMTSTLSRSKHQFSCTKCTAKFNSRLIHNWHIHNCHGKRIVYVYDQRLIRQCNKIPVIRGRATMVHELIKSYDLLSEVDIVSSVPVSAQTLKTFHGEKYVDFLRTANDDSDSDKFGLNYDCPILPRMFNFVRIIAGGSFVAARELIQGTKLAMNWCGGWHHAMSSEAQGFCYVNDIVIAMKKLLQKFQRILYIDLDVHHGNGVESAFIDDPRVLTMSLHLYEPGFYPCTGAVEEVGNESALYSTVNIPFHAGLSDQNLISVFSWISEKVLERFSPDAIVVQCGADGLNKDPLGGFSLTLQGLGSCVQRILSWDLPTLFLGGGGYNAANAARLWTYLTSLIVGKEISNDIPDHKYFLDYGKGYSYELHISPGQRVDLNTPEYLDSIVTKVLENLQHL